MKAVSLNPIDIPRERLETRSLSIPLYLYATVFASLCVAVGINWDISWHMSIGRDGLLSPPHLAIYLGALVSGLFSGYEVLRISFWGSAQEKDRSVRFWGIFYGSLGALFCIWGAMAMLTSAPFDDWWHNTYGLDVTILSPPHTVLALGIIMVQFGAIISVLSVINQSMASGTLADQKKKVLKVLFVLSAGFLLCMVYTLFSEYLRRDSMHNVLFYQVSALAFPIFLVAVSKAYPGKWGATLMATVYTFFMMVMTWILPLFPAEPLLGPIMNPITHFQPYHFPVLLVVPALGIDIILHRLTNLNRWLQALAIAAVFVLSFMAVQWPFGDFLMSPAARNWFFAQESWYYGLDPNAPFRYNYLPHRVSSGSALVQGTALAIALAFVSSRIGISWGRWMKQIQR
jgi:hypothetical protein